MTAAGSEGIPGEVNQSPPGSGTSGEPSTGQLVPAPAPHVSLKAFASAFSCMQLKEMCRRELDKAESEIKKNSSIIGDYKQVGLCAPDGAAFSGSPVCPDGLCPLHTQVLPGSAAGTDASLRWTRHLADAALSRQGSDRRPSRHARSARSRGPGTWLRARRVGRHSVRPRRVLGSIPCAGSGRTFT